MLVVTKTMAEYAVKNLNLPAHLASDINKNRDAIQSHIIKAIDNGEVKYSTIANLDKPKTGEEMIRDSVAEAMAPMADAISGLAKALGVRGNDGYQTPSYSSNGAGAKAYSAHARSQSESTPDEVRVRVKSISESFDGTKRLLNGQTKSMSIPALESSAPRSFDGISQLDKAVAGATLKYLVNRGASGGPIPGWAKMTDLDRALMEYAAHELPWQGPIGMRSDDGEDASMGWVKGGKLQGIQIKAVLDDNTSGGLEAVPIVFDDLAILTPLLVSELLPLVDQRVTTARRVEGFKVANPTMYWTAEGTAPTEFSTTGFISEFNTNIHPCVGWMEVGLDFQADSPVAIADLIIGNYARKAANELENKIASGSGTGEPLGLTQTASAIEVASTNDVAGPPTVADYEALMFAVPKEYRQEAGNRFVYVGNDVSYKRARGIQVGSSDQRRIFGGNGSNYILNDMPYKVNHTIDDSVVMAACMNRYVLYRRAGFQIRRVTESSDLAKKNLELLVMRMRYGGQMSDGNALAIMSDAQSGT
jgi:HK97 family phage major capsid protein